jgi:hypothetical protein
MAPIATLRKKIDIGTTLSAFHLIIVSTRDPQETRTKNRATKNKTIKKKLDWKGLEKNRRKKKVSKENMATTAITAAKTDFFMRKVYQNMRRYSRKIWRKNTVFLCKKQGFSNTEHFIVNPLRKRLH